MPFVKRTILVTGASSGIGRAIAKKLLNQGHCIIGVSRDIQKFITPHANFYPLEMDLSQLSQLAKHIKSIQAAHPCLDAAIFAAGYGRFGNLENFSYSQIEHLITVNFTSVAFLARALLPDLKQKSGADLIFIGSEAALQGSRKGTIYCASKFALRGFSQALRDECAGSVVRVGLINPGMVQTPFFENLNFEAGHGIGQHLSAEDIAEAVSYMLYSSRNAVIDEINLTPPQRVIYFKK